MEWTKLSEVCPTWRTVAVQSPISWTSISVAQEGLRFHRLCLELSGKMPLDIFAGDFDFSDVYGESHSDTALESGNCIVDVAMVVDIISKYSHRIRIVRLPIPESESDLEMLVASLNTTMPLLSVRALGSGETYIHASEPEASFTPAPLVHQYPSLHSLTLERIGIPWDSPILTSLVGLELNLIQRPSSMEVFLEILDACPRLQRLVAFAPGLHPKSRKTNLLDDFEDDCGSNTNNDEPQYPPPTRTVALQHMRDFRMEATRQLRCPLEDGIEYDVIPNIAHAIPKDKTLLPLFSETRSVRIYVTDVYLEVRGYTVDCSVSDNITASLILHFSDYIADRSTAYLLPVVTVQVAQLFSSSLIVHWEMLGDWEKIFSFLPLLEHLKLNIANGVNCEIKPLFKILLPSFTDEKLFCPRLKTLFVEIRGNFYPKTAKFTPIVDGLAFRSSLGTPLHSLSLPSYCPTSKKLVGRLKSLVGTALELSQSRINRN
ncbi:hypothetical protein SCP_0806060 [Sparassis crispa]|uniref:F-box domain-containing protein n=1 Tax=Sparassis crispa TaxID=139825 RepID=A0A401GV54_9APHY|nr:hypothetical protein SCP_0806060 [Sparassis crispa]GBE86082.1 hypothetical protein SCP_0806060 [Sparassis crispa]